ncbi:MAG: Uma2 family endonuclease [Acaryochloris sp. RU_4_1]|nr:Uma2 family endonuclease [Acaryochloris sp. RU_4_1]NJN38092.1 Uma2 family endonuclease [Acaryochloridaceae cyanobacterium CSU_3_4]NJR53536.1 Uma2 family endonuclease [Acaryochloris sp. CRU_2_0]
MIANPYSATLMTAEAYLEWEQHQEIRHEYEQGEVVAMTGGTIPHNDIALNVYTALRPHIRDRGCRGNVADVKVQANPQSAYYYPDVVVSCDPRDLNARKLIQYPKLIVEVLSPSTEARDRGEKFAAYRQLPSLQEYVLIDSERISVECYRRGEGRLWLYSPYIEADPITFDSIEFECAISLLYEGVSLGIEDLSGLGDRPEER